MGWSVQADVSGNDSVGQQEAADWGIDTDFVPTIEDRAWNMTANVLNPNASKRNTLLGFAGLTADEFDFIPEDVELEPEFIQADFRDWNIIDESQF